MGRLPEYSEDEKHTIERGAENLALGMNTIKIQLPASSPAFYEIINSFKAEENKLIIKYTPTIIEMIDGQPEITLGLVGSERKPK